MVMTDELAVVVRDLSLPSNPSQPSGAHPRNFPKLVAINCCAFSAQMMGTLLKAAKSVKLFRKVWTFFGIFTHFHLTQTQNFRLAIVSNSIVQPNKLSPFTQFPLPIGVFGQAN